MSSSTQVLSSAPPVLQCEAIGQREGRKEIADTFFIYATGSGHPRGVCTLSSTVYASLFCPLSAPPWGWVLGLEDEPGGLLYPILSSQ